MDDKSKQYLQDASGHLGQAKVAIYKAETQWMSLEDINEINRIWWSLDDLHKQVSKLI